VTQLIVAINKLEKLIWNQDRYDYIVAQLHPYLLSVGFKTNDLTYLPISGLKGENLIEKCNDHNLVSWWKGDCLIDLLDNL